MKQKSLLYPNQTTRKEILILILVLFILNTTLHAQTSNKDSFSVQGEVLKPLKLTVTDLVKFKQTEVTAKDKDGKEHLFKGVALVSILDSAGVTLGKQLRGKNLAKYVLVKAIDGYEVIFSLPEIDPEFNNQIILLTYQVDGSPLPNGEGPFRIVVPNDKKHARWIREVSSIQVLFSKE